MDNVSGLAGFGTLDDIYAEFPISAYGTFISDAVGGAITDAHDGMIAAITAAGQSNAEPGTGQFRRNPYTDKLLYLSGLDDVFKSTDEVYLEGLQVYVYDPKILENADPQTLAVNNAVQASLATPGNVLPQAMYLNGMAPQWQPNWLNPTLTIDGKRFLTSSGASGNKAFRSIGLPHPICHPIQQRLTPTVRTIDFQAMCGNWIPGLDVIRRFFVVGILWFRLKK